MTGEELGRARQRASQLGEWYKQALARHRKAKRAAKEAADTFKLAKASYEEALREINRLQGAME